MVQGHNQRTVRDHPSQPRSDGRASEELKRKLIEVDAAFAMLDRPVPEAIKGQLKLQLIDESTGAVRVLRDLQDEIAVLEGRATEAGMKMAEMLEAGVPREMVARFQQLSKIRDRLAEQRKEEANAERERQREDASKLAEQRQEVAQIQERLRTPGEAFELELSKLESLRAAIDPESNTPLLDEETYRRELERLHARQIELAASDARKLNGGPQEFSNQDLRSQGGANLIADLFNGRQDITERQLMELVRNNELQQDLIDVMDGKLQVRKVTF